MVGGGQGTPNMPSEHLSSFPFAVEQKLGERAIMAQDTYLRSNILIGAVTPQPRDLSFLIHTKIALSPLRDCL
jgi:hypothetical protein